MKVEKRGEGIFFLRNLVENSTYILECSVEEPDEREMNIHSLEITQIFKRKKLVVFYHFTQFLVLSFSLWR